jgi:hypothetical protein
LAVVAAALAVVAEPDLAVVADGVSDFFELPHAAKTKVSVATATVRRTKCVFMVGLQ